MKMEVISHQNKIHGRHVKSMTKESQNRCFTHNHRKMLERNDVSPVRYRFL